VKICVTGIRKIHAKISTSVPLRNREVISIDFCVAVKTRISGFSNTPPFVFVKSTKSTTFAILIEIY
jgi:hypothetical protein